MPQERATTTTRTTTTAQPTSFPRQPPPLLATRYLLITGCSVSRLAGQCWREEVAVGTARADGPRTDPSVRNYRTGLLP
jgi:hypothetical protein